MKLSEGREISALEQGEGFKYLSVWWGWWSLLRGNESKTDKVILTQDKIHSEIEVERKQFCAGY